MNNIDLEPMNELDIRTDTPLDNNIVREPVKACNYHTGLPFPTGRGVDAIPLGEEGFVSKGSFPSSEGCPGGESGN